MTPKANISAIHHITAVSSSAAENLAFYEHTLGLRLVKQTVNFDDPYTYHLYYGDAEGAPGTIMTFFPWDNLPRGQAGSGMITAVAFAVSRDSVSFWKRRLQAAGSQVQSGERFGEPFIRLADPHGLTIELVGTLPLSNTGYWKQSRVPQEHAIHGFHSATATLDALDNDTARLLKTMGLTEQGREGSRYRFKTTDAQSPGHLYDIVVDPQAPAGRPGTGTVHHIAFRTENDESQFAWQSRIRNTGIPVTDVRDRKYFRSIYFRSPGGILFEIATDPPGFAVDEPPAELGTTLKLPRQYETIRPSIEKGLPPLRPHTFKHVFVNAPHQSDNRTFVTLHGTGGSEHDLIAFARQAGRLAVLSPRGQVLENGRARFFKRVGPNIFDQQDVNRRAHELADFLRTQAAQNGRDPRRLVALGYSNGANMAAAIMMLRPEIFAAAVLLRPLMPLIDTPAPELKTKQVLILKGARDMVIPGELTDRLAQTLTQAGAAVTTRTIDAGHELTDQDLDVIADWLAEPSPA
jgi:predicted esterase/catechol 2,3-dioxygenase-like lactoylglutathione lyase family enzyme